jgi:CBS domain-containing protein
MNVDQAMTRDVKACGPNDSLSQAAQVMWESDCGCVPVVDDEGRVIGMLTDRDICMAAYTRGQPISNMTVASAASGRLISVQPLDTLATAEQRMREHQIRRLPVVDGDGKLVGLLSTSDLVRHARMGHRSTDASADSIVKTLLAICQPIAQAVAVAAE